MVLGIPTLAALVWFFAYALPRAMDWLFPQSRPRRYLVATVTVCFTFGFYGAVGFLSDAPSARHLSSLAVFVFMPLMLALELVRLRRNVQTVAVYGVSSSDMS